MKNQITDKTAIILFLIGLILTTLIFFLIIDEKERSIINAISYFGTFCSIFGLLLAYFQILSVKTIAENTKLEVTATTERLKRNLFLAEFSKGKSIINELRNFIRNRKVEFIDLRFKDLKEVLNIIKDRKELQDLRAIGSFKTVIRELGIDATNISTMLHGNNKGITIDYTIVIRNLDKCDDILSDMLGELKFEQNDK